MDELLSQFGSGLFSLRQGDKVKAKVLRKEPGRVFFDIGGKSEGLVAEKAYKEAEEVIKTLEVGDEITAFVIVPETSEGFTILSLRDALQEESWKKVQNSFEKGIPIEVSGKSVNPSGITVSIGGLNGFVPASQLGEKASQNPQSLVGNKFKVVVIEVDKENKRIIASEKEVSEAEELAKQRKALKNIKEGEIFEGEVLGVYDFGCFVRIQAPAGKGGREKVSLEGLVHISELSWDKVEKASDVVSEGQKVKVKVIGKRSNKLAFSIKKTQEDPWERIGEKYSKEKKVEGLVSKVSDFGLFVSLEPGVEGLVHVTKIPPEKRFEVGDKIKVFIEDIDKEKKKISLGLVLTEKPVGYK